MLPVAFPDMGVVGRWNRSQNLRLSKSTVNKVLTGWGKNWHIWLAAQPICHICNSGAFAASWKVKRNNVFFKFHHLNNHCNNQIIVLVEKQKANLNLLFRSLLLLFIPLKIEFTQNISFPTTYNIMQLGTCIFQNVKSTHIPNNSLFTTGHSSQRKQNEKRNQS